MYVHGLPACFPAPGALGDALRTRRFAVDCISSQSEESCSRPARVTLLLSWRQLGSKQSQHGTRIRGLLLSPQLQPEGNDSSRSTRRCRGEKR